MGVAKYMFSYRWENGSEITGSKHSKYTVWEIGKDKGERYKWI